jgi:hypothetical protein
MSVVVSDKGIFLSGIFIISILLTYVMNTGSYALVVPVSAPKMPVFML